MTLSRPILFTGLLLLLAATPAAAFAQQRGQEHASSNEQPLEQSLRGPAKEAYTYARMLFDNGDFTAAFAKYRLAYEQSHDPRLLYDMALCERNLRAYARMQSLLQQYEDEAGGNLSSSDRSAVDAALAAIRNIVGSVTVRVNEEGATVFVDGTPMGTTPLAAPLVLDLGKHTIVVKKPGFEPNENTIEISGGSGFQVDLSLTRQSHGSRLAVEADAAATVIIDGTVVGHGHFDGPAASGMHEIEVTQRDKVPYRVRVALREGEMRSINVTLENEKSAGAVWPWIIGGVTVAAGAAVGGYFLFKSSDHPPAQVSGDFNVHFSSWGR
jgi:hypothetical protein